MFFKEKNSNKNDTVSVKKMVEELAYNIKEKDRRLIQSIFEDNANYFSKHNKHHSKFIKQLFKYFNKYFNEVVEPFTENDLDCEECQTTIIKVWSTIIYEIWEKEII